MNFKIFCRFIFTQKKFRVGYRINTQNPMIDVGSKLDLKKVAF